MTAALLALLLAAGAAPRTVDLRCEDGARVRAVRLEGPVAVDGALDEPVWSRAVATTAFSQLEPVEGAAATERTELLVAYDDAALYVGARLLDREPGGIVARLGRRDAWLGDDAFVLYLDPYRDGRSGYFFSLNAGGTRRDGILFNDGWEDESWDGVWEGEVARDGRGWTAEMRIPYSQLRFREGERQAWGVNARRFLARKKEDAYLAVRPKKESGFVSRFPQLEGLDGIRPPRKVMVSPYLTARGELGAHEAGDPFDDGSVLGRDLGLDARVGLGPDLTLDVAVNPDFGQVEVDPAVVNLSAAETYYPEKRAFFVEGSRLFSFGQGGASNFVNFGWDDPLLFYSRRIGRAPAGEAPEGADFAALPSTTRILGAAKLTGKLGEGWNLGTLHALTGRGFARVSTEGERSRSEVEPAAYHGVFRLQREAAQNRRGLGFLGTAVVRGFDDPALRDVLNARSFAAGLDGWSFLDRDKTWVVTGWAAASRVEGSQARLADVQQGYGHYLQRPDATTARFDPSATALSGWAGRATLNKEKGDWLVNAAAGAISPGFDVGDLGFQWRGDVRNAHVWGSRRWTEPRRFTRYANVDVAVFRSWDFDGNRTVDGVFGYAFAQLRNDWKLQAWGIYNPETLSSTRTRGGPLTRNPRGGEWDLVVRSDDRRAFWVRANVHGWGQAEDAASGRFGSLSLEWRPAPRLSLSLAPQVEDRHDRAQYVDTLDDATATATHGRRYLFGDIDQRTLSAGVRLSWTFSPGLSLQLYAQPLVSSGSYRGFASLERPRSFSFAPLSSLRREGDEYVGDPDGEGPAAPLRFDAPDFSYRSLRGNVVLRWEFRPGSTLYAVWTQDREDEEADGRFRLGRSLDRLVGAPADNVFLVKIAYWWSR